MIGDVRDGGDSGWAGALVREIASVVREIDEKIGAFLYMCARKGVGGGWLVYLGREWRRRRVCLGETGKFGTFEGA